MTIGGGNGKDPDPAQVSKRLSSGLLSGSVVTVKLVDVQSGISVAAGNRCATR